MDEFQTLFRYFFLKKRKARKQKRRKSNNAQHAHFLAHKQRAYDIAYERSIYFAQIYGVDLGRITIRNQRTRWGSCSKAGNLNFNYRILLIPAHLRDYVIVHEICHLLEFNHSEKFWALVSKTIPDFALYRQELRRMQIMLQ